MHTMTRTLVAVSLLLLVGPAWSAELSFGPAELKLDVADAVAVCNVPPGPTDDATVCSELIRKLAGKAVGQLAAGFFANPAGGDNDPCFVMVSQRPFPGADQATSQQLTSLMEGVEGAARRNGVKIKTSKPGSPYDLGHYNGLRALRYTMELTQQGQGAMAYMFLRKSGGVMVQVNCPLAQLGEMKIPAERIAESVRMPTEVSKGAAELRTGPDAERKRWREMGELAGQLARQMLVMFVALAVVVRLVLVFWPAGKRHARAAYLCCAVLVLLVALISVFQGYRRRMRAYHSADPALTDRSR
jgi:hypothetical protein